MKPDEVTANPLVPLGEAAVGLFPRVLDCAEMPAAALVPLGNVPLAMVGASGSSKKLINPGANVDSSQFSIPLNSKVLAAALKPVALST